MGMWTSKVGMEREFKPFSSGYSYLQPKTSCSQLGHFPGCQLLSASLQCHWNLTFLLLSMWQIWWWILFFVNTGLKRVYIVAKSSNSVIFMQFTHSTVHPLSQCNVRFVFFQLSTVFRSVAQTFCGGLGEQDLW